MRPRGVLFYAALVGFLVPLGMAATAQAAGEPFTIHCPADPGPFVGVEPMPRVQTDASGKTSVSNGADGWSTRVDVASSYVPIWQELEVRLPAFDGVVLVCSAKSGFAAISASTTLRQTSCEPDQANRQFKCQRH